MEDVLEVYARPYDPGRPVVCLDETSKQLVAHSREPLPARPGEPEAWDHRYVRKGGVPISLSRGFVNKAHPFLYTGRSMRGCPAAGGGGAGPLA